MRRPTDDPPVLDAAAGRRGPPLASKRRSSPPVSPLPLIRAAVYVFLAVVLVRAKADTDLWGHVLFGGDIVTHRGIARTDPYSFTADQSWINHEWLAEVLSYLAYRGGGSAGLVALRLAVVLATLLIVSRTIRRERVAPLVHDILLLVVAVGSFARLASVRPQIFSLLLFTAVLAILVKADHGQRKALLWLPPLFAFWANLHGGFIVGLGVLGAWAAWRLLAGPPGWGDRLGVAGAVGASAAATAVNPYGLGLWKFLLETVGFGRPTIADWLPLSRFPVLLAFWAIPALTAVLVLVRTGMPRNRSYLVVVGALAFASLRVSRLDAFFCLSVVVLLSPQLGRARRESAEPVGLVPRRSLGAACVTAAAAAVMLVPAGQYVATNVTCIAVQGPTFPEPEAAPFILANGLRGRMFTFFDYGEYAIWYLGPGVRVSMDGRRETVYSRNVVDSHWKAYYGEDEASAYADFLHADYAWLRLDLAAVKSLERRGWVPIFRGERSVVLARSAPKTLVQARPIPLPRCFPGP